jgi:tetratricopeptide (TPR) repeat protein
MKKIVLVILLINFCILKSFALQTGENAVKLKVSKWLKNGPISLRIHKQVPKDRRKDLFVLVLWGSWSPACRESVPMLVYLQNKYRDKNMQIIAISREKRETIEKFIDEQPQINYAVAVDDQSLTTLHYLGESRLLPRIYIIDAYGKIIWDGEVADLSVILKKMYKGTYNAYIQKQVSRFQQELEVSLRSGNITETIKISDKILKLDPENGFAIRMRMFVYENQRQVDKAWDFLNSLLKKTPGNAMLYFVKLDFVSRFPQYNKYSTELAEAVKKHFYNDPQMLNNMAWGLLTRFPFDGKILKPATECIQRALELSKKDKNNKSFYASCLNTMALVYYRCGMVKKALETQREVAKLAMGDKAKNSSDEAEQLYKSALELQKKLSTIKK